MAISPLRSNGRRERDRQHSKDNRFCGAKRKRRLNARKAFNRRFSSGHPQIEALQRDCLMLAGAAHTAPWH